MLQVLGTLSKRRLRFTKRHKDSTTDPLIVQPRAKPNLVIQPDDMTLRVTDDGDQLVIAESQLHTLYSALAIDTGITFIVMWIALALAALLGFKTLPYPLMPVLVAVLAVFTGRRIVRYWSHPETLTISPDGITYRPSGVASGSKRERTLGLVGAAVRQVDDRDSSSRSHLVIENDGEQLAFGNAPVTKMTREECAWLAKRVTQQIIEILGPAV